MFKRAGDLVTPPYYPCPVASERAGRLDRKVKLVSRVLGVPRMVGRYAVVSTSSRSPC